VQEIDIDTVRRINDKSTWYRLRSDIMFKI